MSTFRVIVNACLARNKFQGDSPRLPGRRGNVAGLDRVPKRYTIVSHLARLTLSETARFALGSAPYSRAVAT